MLLSIPSVIVFWGGIDEEKFPILSFSNPSKSIKDFNKYYDDNYGLKPELVDSYLKFKSQVLNDNPLPNRVFKGKEDWYFLGNQFNELFNDSFGNHPFSKFELETIKNNIKAIRDKLESKGIGFYIVVPSNKHRVYSEMLPYRIEQKPTRLEALNSYLKKEIDFELLDLRDTLVSCKGNELLYYKTNTHWNDLGAFIGYRKTLSTLNLDVPKESISDYTIEYKPIKRGDITEMINLKFKESAVFTSKKTTSDIQRLKSKRHHLHFKNPTKTKKLVMYRDSFSNAWIKYFNQSFGETIYFRGYNINYDIINKEKPDVLVFEIIERQLSTILLNL